MRTALIVAACLIVASSGVDVAAQARQGAPRPAMTVFVTSLDGKALAGVWVKATGPVDREGSTDADGVVTLRNLSVGTYRLRFEHDEYITLEKEVMVAAVRSVKANAALTVAPPPPAPPAKPEPVPQVVPASPAGPPAQPTTVSIIDYIEKNYIKNAPWVKSVVGCMPTATAHVLQLRDPVADHNHGDGDEMIYVIAGSGTHRMQGTDTPLSAGVFVVVPRGMTHSVIRRGSNPLMLLTILAGPPCSGT
jgi:mannose-6-phosphate isomerase-like protein (cupin superfamily)